MFEKFLHFNNKQKSLNKRVFDILNLLTTYRIDIKNFGSKTNTVQIESDGVFVSEPEWFTSDQGIGKMVESCHMADTIKIKIAGDGTLRLTFRGKDKRYNGERWPLWVCYQSIKIDEFDILPTPVSVWHDKSYCYEMPVKDGQVITLQIKHSYHQYTEDELKDVLTKLNIKTDIQNEFLEYWAKNIGFTEIKYTWDYVKNNILTKEPCCVDVNDVNQKTTGRLQISVNNIKFESVLIPSKIKKLYVVLSAVGNNLQNEYPQFHRISWCDKLSGFCLYLDDPTRIKIKEKELDTAGYYFGSKDVSYIDPICNIVMKIAKANHILSKNIIFISSSNGGFAALQCCNKLSGSKCIALNPQLDVYVHTKNAFFDLMEISRDDPLFFERLNIVRILKNKKSHFFIFSNILSGSDKKQMEVLYQVAGKKLSLGLTQVSKTTKCLLCEIPAIVPHRAFPDEHFVQIIEKIMTEPITKDQQLICNAFVGEMKRYYFQNKELETLKNNLTTISDH